MRLRLMLYVLDTIARVRGNSGLVINLNPAIPEVAEIRFDGAESWARVMDYLDLVFDWIPLSLAEPSAVR